MSLTRAQLIAGDSGQGPVLPGQVQGVKEGSGVSIANDGTITFDASTSQGVVKTNNPSAFNGYIWPNAKNNSAFLLTSGTGDNLEWIYRGFGLNQDGIATKSIKQAVPFGNFIEPGITETENIPPIGGGPTQATLGSLYWNTSSEQLFVCTSTSGSGTWSEASYGPLDLSEELLSGSFTLYVNPEIGEDTFVTGVRVSGIRKQEATAGYSPQRPFRTIARAAVEVARLQNGFGNDSQFFDRYVIKCSAGVHYVDNSVGSSVSAWADEFIPQDEDLRKLNSSSKSGIILPRGVSVIGEDLRKTVIRPSFVPNKTGNQLTGRGSIFRITGAGFFFNFTFKDKEGYLESHHLLDCFSFVSDANLESYYDKVRTVFSQPVANDSVEPGETEIVAPKPPGAATVDTDGVMGSSPYIFNCSVRSAYGLCGIFADGSQVTGLKSMVTAQFTGVSLQRDPYCWEKYNPLTKQWVALTGLFYEEYIQLSPNDLRMNPDRRSFHIKAINEAFIQEVSVFAIGHGVHHWSESGGELSITNSNSSFGGCAAIAEGYKEEAFPQDTNWNISSLKLATNLSDQTPIVRSFYLGVVSPSTENNSTTIILETPLEDSDSDPGVPQILSEFQYSLKEDSYLWIENPEGPDWRAPLGASAWDPESPSSITVKIPMENQDEIVPGEPKLGGFWPSLSENRVFIRRLIDSRSLDKRRYSVECTNTDSNTRTPPRDYVIQTSVGSGAGIVGNITDSDLTLVNKSGPIPIGGDPVVRKVQIVLQSGNPSSLWVAGPDKYYRPGDTVKYENKHFTCVVSNADETFDPFKWNESYVHMPSGYNAYDYAGNVAPQIIFDDDTDGVTPTQTCGYNLTTCWTQDPEIRRQYRSTTDYKGVYKFLKGVGFTDNETSAILVPRPASERSRNTASPADMLNHTPSGAANILSNWAVEFRRPSIVRMFGHAWEWAGYLNYSKALPSYQRELSPQNQFTYYFSNSGGGKVYATGYNQEGYLITPAGLTDLETGSLVSPASIGSSDTGVDVPTFYENLGVNNLNINTEVVINGTVRGRPTWDGGYGGTLPALPVSTTQQRGIIQLATSEQAQAFIRDDLAISPASLFQALGDSIKSVVNLRISLSAQSAVPSGNQLNSTNIFVHPYNGSELSLYSSFYTRWQVVRFSGVLQFSLAAANSANTNYDIYIYNNGTPQNPQFSVEYVAWTNDTTPPGRDTQDGVIVRNNNPDRRLIGVVRTTTAGTSTIDLGGTIPGAASANFPRLYLANLHNLYDARAVYFFGTSWNVIQWGAGFGVVPSSVYATTPRISWVQASDTMVTAFLDIYNNTTTGGNPNPAGAVVYVAPGVDSTTGPPEDAFYGEVSYDNCTAGSQWARALSPGKHDIYYLYQQSGLSLVNEHPAHGMIVTFKV